MKKLFISQPMRGLSDEEIKAKRKELIAKVKTEYPDEEIQVIDSFFEGAPADAKPLWFLGKSIQMLSDADVAIFAKGWEDMRGCVIEHDCAVKYGIKTIEE